MKRILFGLAALSASGVAQAQAQERPNILFICIDDLRTELGAYGSKGVITPNLDRLAAEGRLFHRHYVQAPTSGASRAMMLTGIGATSQEQTNNISFSLGLIGSQEGERPESFVHHLRRDGYYTVRMGKVSHSDNGYIYPNGQKIKELPYSWDEYVSNPTSPWPDNYDTRLHGYEDGFTHSMGVTPKLETESVGDDPRYYSKGESPAFDFKDRPDESYADGELANLATAQLEKLSKSDRESPFFMAVGFYKPHLPFTAPKRYWDMYDGVDISLSPSPELPEGVDKAFLHSSVECFGQYSHPEKGGIGVVLSEEYASDLRRAYYSALTFTDAQVGKVLDKLEQTGLDKNTIVIVWGDHGWHLGDHTIWGKQSLFERALNSTFMVKTPDMKRAGKGTDALVATVDLYPTMCELAGVEVPDGLDGVSFVDLLDSERSSVREYVVSYWANTIGVRDDRYRFALYKRGDESAIMLFDHKRDPYERVNVAEQNPKVVERFMEIVRRENRGFLKGV
ncbi:MAG: sulfatase [Rikenellaceae bacterium]